MHSQTVDYQLLLNNAIAILEYNFELGIMLIKSQAINIKDIDINRLVIKTMNAEIKMFEFTIYKRDTKYHVIGPITKYFDNQCHKYRHRRTGFSECYEEQDLRNRLNNCIYNRLKEKLNDED